MNAVPAESARLRGALCDAIVASRATLAAYLPPHVPVARFLALAQRAVVDNRDVWHCSSASVLRALAAAAASGLPIDGKMSSLVVRKSKNGAPTCTWDPSYRGMVYLALESGHVKAVEAYAVRAKDHFEVILGTDPQIVHRPFLGDDRGDVIASYAVAELKSGGTVREVLGLSDLARIRAASPAAERGPWASWPDRMAMKSAMRRLLKRLPAADIGTLERARQHVVDTMEDPDGSAFRASADTVRRTSTPDETAGLEAQALEAISDAQDESALSEAWVGIRAAFRRVGAEMPLGVEARYDDRREALAQDGDH